MTAVWKGAHPGNFRAGRRGHQPITIVLHIMEGTLAGTDAWFNDRRSGVSAHYGIGTDGRLHQYVRETDTAFHAGTVDRPTEEPRWSLYDPRVNPNYVTIGIEHEGRDSTPWPWPEPMLKVSLELVREIAHRWDIPLDGAHVVTHHMIRKGKTCPGSRFRLDDYLARLTAVPAAAEAPQPAEWSGEVRAVAAANLRRSPSTASLPIGKLLQGDAFDAKGLVVQGETVRGNSRWFVDDEQRYLWAGATDRPTG